MLNQRQVTVLVNGEPEAHVQVNDRGFLYGDGVFETMAISQGAPPLWEYHLRRLRSACGRLGLECPGEGQILSEIARVAPFGEAVVRLVLTRGPAETGYAAPRHPKPTRVVMLVPAPPGTDPNAGLTVGMCKTRLAANPALAGIKHLCRLEQVLAATEVRKSGWDEGLMLDQLDRVVEATHGNVLVCRAGSWFTPVLDECGVAGVYREYLLDRGVVREASLGVADLPRLEAMAICNSVRGVRLVSEVFGVVQYQLDEALNWLAGLKE